MIYRHLVVDNKCDNRITEIVTQREHGVTIFEIKCLNNGYDIDLTDCVQAQFYGEKSDGHKVGVKCDFNEDKTAVLLPLILQMTTTEGLLNGVLELSFESGNIRFSGINFKVVSAPDDTGVESKDEFTIFERCLLKPERDGETGQVLTLGSDGKNVWQNSKGGSDYVLTDEDKTEIVSIATEQLKPSLNSKQNILVSGENIKTINGESVLGSGNIEISGGSSSNGNLKITYENYTLTENTAIIAKTLERSNTVYAYMKIACSFDESKERAIWMGTPDTQYKNSKKVTSDYLNAHAVILRPFKDANCLFALNVMTAKGNGGQQHFPFPSNGTGTWNDWSFGKLQLLNATDTFPKGTEVSITIITNNEVE